MVVFGELVALVFPKKKKNLSSISKVAHLGQELATEQTRRV